MATRNTALRLVEGRTYSSPVQREELRVWRAPLPKLVGRFYQQSSVVTNGTLEPVGGPTLVQRQKISVGQIVSLHTNRSSTVRGSAVDNISPAVMEGLPGPRWASRVGDALLIPQYRESTVPWVVMATDGKFMRVRLLAELSSYSARLVAARGDVPARVINSRYGSPDIALTAVEIGRLLRGTMATTTNQRLARVSHVINIYEPSDFPAELYEAIRNKIREEAGDCMFTRLAQTYPARRVRHHSHYTPMGVATREARGKSVATNFSKAAKYWTSDPEEAMYQLRNAVSSVTRWVNDYQDRTTLPGIGTERAAAAVARWAAKCGVGPLTVASGCGHFHAGDSVELVTDRYGQTGKFCPECAEGSRLLTLDSGREAMVTAVASRSAHNWSDGTVRFNREPGVIGGRHSGKGIVGFVQPLGFAAQGYRTLGLELEMQAYNGHEREPLAKEMKNRLRDTNLLDEKACRKYLHFEEDGSTGIGGFEMVTGYSNLATHADLLRALLSTPTGSPAFSGKLRSHDADGQSCGIHVHIAKPKRLIHAMKMRYFINATQNAGLIKTVARRYSSGGYAKVQNRLVPTPQESDKQTAKFFKESKRYGQSASKTATSAIDRINANDRYEALNFQNEATVEFRIFRGSMLYGTVMACMEFTLATYDFCLVTSTVNLTTVKFVEWVNRPENRKQTVNLRQYLKRKGFDVVVPKPVKGLGVNESAAELLEIN